ncbi:dGTPase [Desulfobaculum xiamenense]|uniref:dGTPase n=1 Tax=Desulfobaculum xiamenense TaxID=995050 RepID=A0A846QN74_9BACT|nr:deoxyguanosinetriphosphate triphosphohydrolase [Desulfobaculum xiamenense]NJB66684.1 dGTPase [Desulfobaculum xiamenense]
MLSPTEQQAIWEKLLHPHRFSRKENSVFEFNPQRNPFIIDYDRIIFSSSFRRLSKKTQVHPLTRNDHIHNRLTHSLEVSCVGKTLGTRVGYFLKGIQALPNPFQPENIGEIVQAACLAHDIGNPPFGHAGESAIQDWFKDPINYLYIEPLTAAQRTDFQAIDGNAQGFRVINSIENNKDSGGLRLTYPTIATMVKYPNSSHQAAGRNSTKFNYYQAEQDIFNNIFSSLNLISGNDTFRHPLSYLSEAADDICYRIIDMEDARELNIINLDDIIKITEPLCGKNNIDKGKLSSMDSDRRRTSMVRTLTIGALMDSTIEAFKEQYESIISNTHKGPITKYADDDTKKYMSDAKDIFYTKIIKNPQKTALEIGSYTLYKRLLDVFIPACYNQVFNKTLTYRQSQALSLMGVNAPTDQDKIYNSYLRVIDFITGMTDSYATFISKQFSGTAQN